MKKELTKTGTTMQIKNDGLNGIDTIEIKLSSRMDEEQHKKLLSSNSTYIVAKYSKWADKKLVFRVNRVIQAMAEQPLSDNVVVARAGSLERISQNIHNLLIEYGYKGGYHLSRIDWAIDMDTSLDEATIKRIKYIQGLNARIMNPISWDRFTVVKDSKFKLNEWKSTKVSSRSKKANNGNKFTGEIQFYDCSDKQDRKGNLRIEFRLFKPYNKADISLSQSELFKFFKGIFKQSMCKESMAVFNDRMYILLANERTKNQAPFNSFVYEQRANIVSRDIIKRLYVLEYGNDTGFKDWLYRYNKTHSPLNIITASELYEFRRKIVGLMK